MALPPLRSATVLSLVFAAFSSFSFVVSKRTTSSWPSSSVAAHLVVLDGLYARGDRGVQHGLVLGLACRLVGFLDDAVDGRTLATFNNGDGKREK